MSSWIAKENSFSFFFFFIKKSDKQVAAKSGLNLWSILIEQPNVSADAVKTLKWISFKWGLSKRNDT